MYVDSQLLLTGTPAAPAQAVTTTAISANVIDMLTTTTGGAGTPLNTLQALGVGECLYLMVSTVVGFGTSANTLTVSLETSANADLSSGVVLAASAAIATSALTAAGTPIFSTRLPLGDYRRYLGLRFTCSAALTTGTVVGFLTTAVQANFAHISNFTAA
jgi:hypothetical protein